MLVKNWMNTPAVTIDAEASMKDAVKIMKEGRIRMLPVLKKGKLAGVVTDRDLKRASASDATTLEIHELMYLICKIKIRDVMTPNPITVYFDHTVEETAEILLMNKISGVPVMDYGEKVVGTITQTDLFRVIISLTGVGKRGVQFAFQLEDRPGSIKEVTDVIRDHDGRMVSILSSYEGVPDGFRKVYVRCYGVDKEDIDKLKEMLKKKATLLYLINHRENKREIYC